MKENSIEEDIILLNDFAEGNFQRDKLENYKGSYKMGYFYYKDIQQALEHILSDYKRVLKINKVLIKENEELKERIREHTLLISPYYVKENFIPVQKVKEKIEYLDNQQKQWLEDRKLKASDSEIIFSRDILQKLLESEE